MFAKERWAAAFVSAAGEDLDEGLSILRVCVGAALTIPGTLSGHGSAERLEKILRRGMERAGVAGPGAECACRFLTLFVRKGRFGPENAASLLAEIERIRDNKNGTVTARLYSAYPADAETVEQVRDCLWRARGNAAGVKEITVIPVVAPELLGGYRLQIGSESVDASLRFLLEEMGSRLQAAPLEENAAGGMA
ncbi:MAG: F0F1 ATP synthase subunit delta [Spirochaetaceae bacterium]|jgi:F0F1-type ATP synthase delta subunit|nr:F0F1 ATP synthase subunit delta [Spirochaetaceae bacterium]